MQCHVHGHPLTGVIVQYHVQEHQPAGVIVQYHVHGHPLTGVVVQCHEHGHPPTGVIVQYHGTLAGTRHSLMGPPGRIDLMAHHTMSRHSTMHLHGSFYNNVAIMYLTHF